MPPQDKEQAREGGLGMHYGFVAVPATVDRLVDEFPAIWPRYEVAQRATLPAMAAYLDWKREHDRFVSARDWTPQNPGVEVYGFLQDGDWAVLLDASYTLAADADALARLSAAFGRCVAFIVETSGGCVSFSAHVEGRLQRRIDNVNGEVSTEGAPLPEEAGLDVAAFHISAAETLQALLGLGFLRSTQPTEVIAVATVDRTDYAALLLPPSPAAAPARKPWWKLW